MFYEIDQLIIEFYMIVKALACVALLALAGASTAPKNIKYRPTIEDYLTRHENRTDNVFT